MKKICSFFTVAPLEASDIICENPPAFILINDEGGRMRSNLKVLVAAVALLCSAGSQAEGVYIGGVFGLMNTDVGRTSPFNVGVRGGYTWSSGWGVEAEYTDSASDGSLDVFGVGVSPTSADYSISTEALYLTYMTSGDLYFKARLGYLNETVDIASFSASDSGGSVGLGGGFKFSENVSFETEYTLIEEDVDLLSGTLIFRF
ncbi:outer membrane beta-barrel protein [Microbulbifer sp. TYP-18]|uniref:outer membrane beta-barrel protein n=1 Tax=Microbulbifer sp. TYP-18 TaxID=3230024 RepID=UPI0034C6D18C